MLTAPTPEYAEDLHRFTWDEPYPITMTLERFVEGKEDIRCEITVVTTHATKGGMLTRHANCLLKGTGSRRDLKNQLLSRDDEPDWGGMLEQALSLSLVRLREGEPLVDLDEYEGSGTVSWLVEPFVFDGEGTVSMLYGYQESGKSTLAMALATAVATGMDIGSLYAVRTGRVLYLDYEDDAGRQAARYHALLDGYQVEHDTQRMIYKRMTGSLHDAVRDLRRAIVEHGIGFVVVDSLGMACGGDPNDPSLIMQTLAGCRRLGVPVLVIHHLPKDAKDKSNPYGSIYASAETRIRWLVEKAQAPGASDMFINLVNHGSNHTEQLRPRSYRIEHERDPHTIRIEMIGVRQAAEEGFGKQGMRAYEYIRDGGPASTEMIANFLGTSVNRVRTLLSRDESFVNINPGGGRGHEAVWAIRDTQHNEPGADSAL